MRSGIIKPLGSFQLRRFYARSASGCVAMANRIKTRVLILSDTHGVDPDQGDASVSIEEEFRRAGDLIKRVPTGYREPLPEADVVVHCGDLSKQGLPHELRATFGMLSRCRAPLKLVIAGNHDLSLHETYWNTNYGARTMYGDAPEASKQIVKNAEEFGVKYLTEGNYTFDLANGARLRVYASQWTPEYGRWAFQYEEHQHEFDISSGVDIAMTHGPPHMILDYAGMSGTNAGCASLFNSIELAKPRIHCFGHIHEGWGAYKARWKENDRTGPAIVKEESRHIAKAAGLRPFFADDEESAERKFQNLKKISEQRGYHVDITDGEDKIEGGKETLFINAAIMDISYRPVQCPWLVDIDLPKAE